MKITANHKINNKYTEKRIIIGLMIGLYFNYMQKEQFFNAKVLFLYGAKI